MKLAALLLLCGTIGFALAAYTQDKAATMPSMPMTNVDPAAHAALLVAENVEKAKLYKAKADAYWNEYRIVRERDVETLGDEAAYASDSESQALLYFVYRHYVAMTELDPTRPAYWLDRADGEEELGMMGPALRSVRRAAEEGEDMETIEKRIDRLATMANSFSVIDWAELLVDPTVADWSVLDGRRHIEVPKACKELLPGGRAEGVLSILDCAKLASSGETMERPTCTGKLSRDGTCHHPSSGSSSDGDSSTSLSQSFPPLPKGQTKVLFPTIVHAVSLLSITPPDFNERLSRLVTNAFHEFASQEPEMSTSELNDGFFGWQSSQSASVRAHGQSRRYAGLRGTSWIALQRMPEFQMLRHYVLEGARKLLREYGRELHPEPELYCWGTYQNNASVHGAHIHDDSVVSIAYYSQIPPNSGDISFEDPRGSSSHDNMRAQQAWPPFIHSFRISPKAGTLVLFPSWLVHQVMPTTGNEERVGFSCNIEGDWITTADADVLPDPPASLHEE